MWEFDRAESAERIQELRINRWAFDERRLVSFALLIHYQVVEHDCDEQLGVSVLPVPTAEDEARTL